MNLHRLSLLFVIVLSPVGRVISSCLVGAEVLTAVVIKSSIFWGITPCSALKVNRRLGGTCHLHLRGRRIRSASYRLHAGFFLGLLFDPEDGGDMFLRNVG
jgi:hypothetical protein